MESVIFLFSALLLLLMDGVHSADPPALPCNPNRTASQMETLISQYPNGPIAYGERTIIDTSCCQECLAVADSNALIDSLTSCVRILPRPTTTTTTTTTTTKRPSSTTTKSLIPSSTTSTSTKTTSSASLSKTTTSTLKPSTTMQNEQSTRNDVSSSIPTATVLATTTKPTTYPNSCFDVTTTTTSTTTTTTTPTVSSATPSSTSPSITTMSSMPIVHTTPIAASTTTLLTQSSTSSSTSTVKSPSSVTSSQTITGELKSTTLSVQTSGSLEKSSSLTTDTVHLTTEEAEETTQATSSRKVHTTHGLTEVTSTTAEELTEQYSSSAVIISVSPEMNSAMEKESTEENASTDISFASTDVSTHAPTASINISNTVSSTDVSTAPIDVSNQASTASTDISAASADVSNQASTASTDISAASTDVSNQASTASTDISAATTDVSNQASTASTDISAASTDVSNQASTASTNTSAASTDVSNQASTASTDISAASTDVSNQTSTASTDISAALTDVSNQASTASTDISVASTNVSTLDSSTNQDTLTVSSSTPADFTMSTTGNVSTTTNIKVENSSSTPTDNIETGSTTVNAGHSYSDTSSETSTSKLTDSSSNLDTSLELSTTGLSQIDQETFGRPDNNILRNSSIYDINSSSSSNESSMDTKTETTFTTNPPSSATVLTPYTTGPSTSAHTVPPTAAMQKDDTKSSITSRGMKRTTVPTLFKDTKRTTKFVATTKRNNVKPTTTTNLTVSALSHESTTTGTTTTAKSAATATTTMTMTTAESGSELTPNAYATTWTPEVRCSYDCPFGSWPSETNDYCYQLLQHNPKGINYGNAVAECTRYPNYLMIDETDLDSKENLNLFLKMMNRADTDIIFLNQHGSKMVRTTRRVPLVSVGNITRFFIKQFRNVSRDEVFTNVSVICRFPKHCLKPMCHVSEFMQLGLKDEFVIENVSKSLRADEGLDILCARTIDTYVSVRCNDRGEFRPHLTMLTCKRPAENRVEPEEKELPGNPRYFATCSECHKLGTKNCTEMPDGLFQCNCKDGWSRFSCWRSPQLCREDSCSGHGTCESRVPILSGSSFGCAVVASTSLFTLLAKIASKITQVSENEDPQDSYQDYRHTTLALGNLGAALFKHPDIVKFSYPICRIVFWIISSAFVASQWMMTNECINVLTLFKNINRNTWDNDCEGKKRFVLLELTRTLGPFVVTFIAVFAAVVYEWDDVPTTWTCMGRFTDRTAGSYVPMVFLMGLPIVLNAALTEGIKLISKFRPHLGARRQQYIDENPLMRHEINKTTRNLPFILPGSILLFFTWLTLALSSDWNEPLYENIALIVSLVFSVFNTVQTVVTSPDLCSKLVHVLIILLPKRLSPDFDDFTMRDREEVLGLYRKYQLSLFGRNWIGDIIQKFIREKMKKEVRAEKARKEAEKRAEVDKIEARNADLRARFPGIPAGLLFHVPEEGPEGIIREYSWAPSHKYYVTRKERELMHTEWSMLYVQERIQLKSPRKAAYAVFQNALKNNLYRAFRYRPQSETIFRDWIDDVPFKDEVRMIPYQKPQKPKPKMVNEFEKKVKEKNRRGVPVPWGTVEPPPLERYTNPNKKPQMLRPEPRNYEKERLEKALAYLAPTIRSDCQLIDYKGMEDKEGGETCNQIFIKAAEIVTDERVSEFYEVWKTEIAKKNEKFAVTYDDDSFYLQWVGTEWEEAAKEVFQPQPSKAAVADTRWETRHTKWKSFNPRKNLWQDTHWTHPERPDFTGPRLVPPPPFGFRLEEKNRRIQWYSDSLEREWHNLVVNSEQCEKWGRGEQ